MSLKLQFRVWYMYKFYKINKEINGMNKHESVIYVGMLT